MAAIDHTTNSLTPDFVERKKITEMFFKSILMDPMDRIFAKFFYH